uniref:Uncharacterized protein n=1 Tax=viral metagenome TaxID=1070528 RepID=A0A6M3K5D2_9ZZZZ
MDLDLIRNEIYEGLGGEPGDGDTLDPDSDTSYNSGPLLTWVACEAQRQLAAWKDPITSRQARFRNLEGDLYFQSKLITGTTAASGTVATTTTLIMSSTYVGTQDDRYNGWVLEVGNDARLIVDYTGSTYTVTVRNWGTVPSNGNTYYLYKSFYKLLPSTHDWVSSPAGEHIVLPSESDRYRATGNLVEILDVEDLEEKIKLQKAIRGDFYVDYVESSGDPNVWFMRGNELHFDKPTEEAKWFRVHYYRLPTDMSASTDEPEIPSQFHYGLVLWGLIWGHRRANESDRAYAAEQSLRDFMRSTLSAYDVADKVTNVGGILRRDY